MTMKSHLSCQSRESYLELIVTVVDPWKHGVLAPGSRQNHDMLQRKAKWLLIAAACSVLGCELTK